MEDLAVINAYKEAFQRYSKDGIIDLDNRLKYKFTFHIYTLQTVVDTLKGVVPPHRHSQYLMTFVKKGSGQKSIGHFTFPIKNNMLMIVPKRVIHSTNYLSLRIEGYVLSFSLDFFLQNAFPKEHIAGKKIFRPSVKPYLLLSKEQVKVVERILEFIVAEHNGGKNSKNEMIAVKIVELLIQCDRFYFGNTSPGSHFAYDKTFDRFNELLERKYKTERSVGFYAVQLNVHPNHLNYVAKKQAGLTAKEMISNRVLLEAKCLLRSTSLSIREITDKLGFDHYEYFYSFFKKHMKETPAKYRVRNA